jgi:hypothetical protein
LDYHAGPDVRLEHGLIGFCAAAHGDDENSMEVGLGPQVEDGAYRTHFARGQLPWQPFRSHTRTTRFDMVYRDGTVEAVVQRHIKPVRLALGYRTQVH